MFFGENRHIMYDQEYSPEWLLKRKVNPTLNILTPYHFIIFINSDFSFIQTDTIPYTSKQT